MKQAFRIELWAAGFHDRVVREDEDIMRCVRYIWNNPVVARLVSDPRAYPHLHLAPEFKAIVVRDVATKPDLQVGRARLADVD